MGDIYYIWLGREGVGICFRIGDKIVVEKGDREREDLRIGFVRFKTEEEKEIVMGSE